MKRGDIIYIENNNREGSMQRGDRPAVIVSNQAQIETSETVQVVYLTTKPKTDLPTHFITKNALAPSTVLCENVYTIPKYKTKEWIGSLSEEEMQELDICLVIALAIDIQGMTEKKGTPAAPEVITALEEENKELKERMGKLEAEKERIAQTVGDIMKYKHQAAVYKEMYDEVLGKLLAKGV